MAGMKALAGVLLLAAGARAQDCHHGTLQQDGSCECTTPWPAVGSIGYTGLDCNLPVLGVDASVPTSVGLTSGDVQASDWQCYAVHIEDGQGTPRSWNFLTIEMARTDAVSDPDLYGMWYAAPDNTDGLTTNYPSTSKSAYDFREISSSSSPVVSLALEANDLDNADKYAGVYMCIFAYGQHDSSYTLAPVLSYCPASFPNLNEVYQCSTLPGASAQGPEFHGSCNEATGHCNCAAAYKVPDELDPYDDLGFDSCAAKISVMPENTSNKLWQGEVLRKQEWSFYEFQVTDDDYQLNLKLVPEGNSTTAGDSQLYVKKGAPPGSGWHEYDIHPSQPYYAQPTNEASEAQITEGDGKFATGRWYAGVLSTGGVDAKFSFEITRFECPRGCSGHGDEAYGPAGCEVKPAVGEEPEQRICHCIAGYLLDDCSQKEMELNWDQIAHQFVVSGEVDSNDYEYFQLPAIQEAEARRHVELEITASYESTVSHTWYYDNAKPVLLMKQADGVADFPTANNYAYKTVMDEEHVGFTVDICPTQLLEGTWKAAIWNPSYLHGIKYNVTLTKSALCPNDCSHGGVVHGTCQQDGAKIGMCDCHGSWAGADCSVDTSLCTDGSFQYSNGCYNECNGGRFTTCHMCMADEWFTEAEGRWSCKRKCTKNEHGVRELGDCDWDTVMCSMPYKRSEQGYGCYMKGCDSGAVTNSTTHLVPHGSCLTSCSCDSEAADFDFPSSNGLPIVHPNPMCEYNDKICADLLCDPDYERVVPADDAPLAVLEAHGQCLPAGATKVVKKGGTPAHTVVVLTFLMLVVGLVSGAYLLEWGKKQGWNLPFMGPKPTYNDFVDDGASL